MSRKRKQYTSEFKKEAVGLVLDQGLTAAQAARDLGVNESVLRRWTQQAQEARGEQAEPPASESERAELKRLRSEVSILRREREILKNAAAFFAKENL
jgi:transposase